MFYGLFGWFANVCLVVNLVLMLGIMSLLQATLTLPGMAGILLTLGMAVDANILINERIREEQRLGRPPLSALEHGFTRAYNTIFDCNVDGVPGARHAVRVRLRAGAGLRRDHHRRHRHLAVHRLDADAAAGVALVCRHGARSCCRSDRPCSSAPCSASFPTTPASSSCGAAIMGLIVSAILSTASVMLFFYPGLNLGIDFSGGIVMEVRTPGPADFAQIRAALAAEQHPRAGRAAVRRRLRGADPARRPADRGGDAAGGDQGAHGAGEGGAGRQGAAHRRGRRLGLARSCSATACWRSASAC